MHALCISNNIKCNKDAVRRRVAWKKHNKLENSIENIFSKNCVCNKEREKKRIITKHIILSLYLFFDRRRPLAKKLPPSSSPPPRNTTPLFLLPIYADTLIIANVHIFSFAYFLYKHIFFSFITSRCYASVYVCECFKRTRTKRLKRQECFFMRYFLHGHHFLQNQYLVSPTQMRTDDFVG